MKKMSKNFPLLMIAVLFVNFGMPTKAWACSGLFGNEKDNPVTFECLYPTPFYKTSAFRWSAIVVVSVGVAVATVYTGGAAGVPGATLIGGMLGTTWTAGLATLGGGTLASGGFGMAGGAFVIATTTDLALAGLASFIPIPKNNIEGNNYNYIKIPLPKIGSKTTLAHYQLIDELITLYHDPKEAVSDAVYEIVMHKYYTSALDDIDYTETKYDLINGAILAYNLGDYKKSGEYLGKAENYFPKSSYIYYHKALLDLVSGSSDDAINNLNQTIYKERDALQPYLLKTQIAIDRKKFGTAKNAIAQGLDKYDSDNFQLNYLGGMASFKDKDYKKAIAYFKDALSNTTINEIEADTKLWIAKSYQRLENNKQAGKWYNDAMSEVSDNKEYKKALEKQYSEKLRK